MIGQVTTQNKPFLIEKMDRERPAIRVSTRGHSPLKAAIDISSFSMHRGQVTESYKTYAR
jgi:hypothetical protein